MDMNLDKILALNIITSIMLNGFDKFYIKYRCIMNKTDDPEYDDFIRYEIEIKEYISEKTIALLVYDCNLEFSLAIKDGEKFDITSLLCSVNPDYDIINNDFLCYVTGLLIDKLKNRNHYTVIGFSDGS